MLRVRNSEFIKNVATLATGTTLAQAVSIFTAPVLYRIYSRVDYGTLGLYMAITGVVGVFSTMQYLQPILLEKEDDEAKKVMWLNRVINIGVTLLTFMLVIISGKYVGKWLNNEGVVKWLYLVPVSIFFSGQNEIFRVWANRKKEYKVMSYNAMLTAILVPIVSISFGLHNNGPLGLFLGLLTSQVIPPIVLLVVLTRKENLGLKYLSLKNIKINAKKYVNFPLYSLPSQLINMLSNQLPVFMLSIYMGPAIVGIYNLCKRMLGIPAQLIGSAIGEVFKQKATFDFNLTGSFNNVFLKTLKSLMVVSLLPFFIIVFFGPDLFRIFFGENWIDAGVLSKYLIFYFLMRLIVSPLSYSIFIKNKLNIGLKKNIFTLIVMFIVLFIGFEKDIFYVQVLATYAFTYSFIEIIYLLYMYKLSFKNGEKLRTMKSNNL